MSQTARATEYIPRRWMRNGHVMTVAGNYLRRRVELPAPVVEAVEVEPGSSVLCLCHWQPEPERGLTVVLVHGLEGSARSQYILGNAARLWRAGCSVVRMNMRTCGTDMDVSGHTAEEICTTLYHSGRSGDVRAVAQHAVSARGARRVAVVGYSMGGNMVLKMAGELAAAPMVEMVAVAAVSPAVDLAVCADGMHHGINRMYERRFLRGLKARYRRRVAMFPEMYDVARLRGVNSIRTFDERIVAPHNDFAGADDYYSRASAKPVLALVPVPTLVLHAEDDPLVKLTADTREMMRGSKNIRLVTTRFGGHCAFLEEPSAGDDGRWAERQIAAFFATLKP